MRLKEAIWQLKE